MNKVELVPLVDLQPLPAQVLALRTIPRADDALVEAWKLPDGMRSLGLVTCTSDDALYVALDEGFFKQAVNTLSKKAAHPVKAHTGGK